MTHFEDEAKIGLSDSEVEAYVAFTSNYKISISAIYPPYLANLDRILACGKSGCTSPTAFLSYKSKYQLLGSYIAVIYAIYISHFSKLQAYLEAENHEK